MACKVGALVGNTYALSQPDRALLRQWLDTGQDGRGRTVPATAMAQALSADGHRVGVSTVKDHRGRRCACYREG